MTDNVSDRRVIIGTCCLDYYYYYFQSCAAGEMLLGGATYMCSNTVILHIFLSQETDRWKALVFGLVFGVSEIDHSLH